MKRSAKCEVRNVELKNKSRADDDHTPHSALVTPHSKGFTLLEVMVAVAILGMVLVSLIGLQNRGTEDVMLADHITTATLLAKREMTDMMLRSSGTSTTDSETEGEFAEEEFENYTWKKIVITLTPIENVRIIEMRVAVLWKEGERQEMVELKSYK